WTPISGIADTIEMRAQSQIVCGLDFPGSRCQEGNKESRKAGKNPSQSQISDSPIENRKSKIENNCSANLPLLIPTSFASQIAGRPGDFIEQTLQTCFPDLAERLAGAVCETPIQAIGCFGHVCRPAVAAGALLVGDAATFIDPFTGEGIYFGLRGALLAAEFATQALRAGDLSRSRLMAYQRARGELARPYLLCRLLHA